VVYNFFNYGERQLKELDGFLIFFMNKIKRSRRGEVNNHHIIKPAT